MLVLGLLVKVLKHPFTALGFKLFNKLNISFILRIRSPSISLQSPQYTQFFIGDLAGTDVKNTIARAILDRVVLAAHRREVFKAIIIVPVHPEGDYVGSSGPLGVMNYQYKTISRCVEIVFPIPTSSFLTLDS